MNRSTRVRLSKLSLGLIAALAVAPAFAQSTSAGVGGVVTDASGQPVAGAEVTILHVESGTVSRATTDASGRYNARGLRVGGPYTVTVNQGGRTDSEDNVFLSLNQVNTVNAQLGGASTLDTVVVSAEGISTAFNPDNKGVGTSVDGRRLEIMPRASRSLDDVARLDPRITVTDQAIGTITMAGVNNRFNTISVDGLSQGDPFGLNANGMPYTGSPISIDTIAAYDVKTSDYDVSQDTVGATVNAVTKSGTNDFSGSAYYVYRSAKDHVASRDDRDYAAFGKDTTWGLTFGGPILRDRLFFFGSYEEQEVTDFGGAAGSDGFSNGVVSQAEIDEVIDIARNVWGIDPGVYGAFGTNLENKRYLGKIDWNINDFHRASLTYQQTEETLPRPYDGSASTVILSTRWYTKNNVTKNTSLQLFSDWTDNFRTEAKFSHQKFDELNGAYIKLPTINITTANNSPGSGQGVRLGEDRNRHENQINAERFNASVFGAWYAGDHELKFGFDYAQHDVLNLYGRDLHGVYTFDSIDAFRAGEYANYTVRRPVGSFTEADTAAALEFSQFSPFIQDTWQVNGNLSLMYGVRVNIPKAKAAPHANPGFEAAFGYPNSYKLGTDNKVVLPRVSFNYTFDTDRMSQLRGGVGLFQSVPPFVWLANPYQNTGVTSAAFSRNAYDPAYPFSVDPYNQPVPSDLAASGQGQVDTIDPDFKLPTVWKMTLGYDAELPWMGLVATAEIQHLRNKHGVFYKAINIGALDPATGLYDAPTGRLADGRDSYWCELGGSTGNGNKNCGTNPGYTYNSTMLSNTDKGDSTAITFALDKPLANGWYGNLSYTLTHANEVGSDGSSQAFSSYQYVSRLNPNEEVLATATREIRNQIKLSLGWERAFFGDYKTSVTAFYNGRDGLPYTWIINGDPNGDRIFQDPAYIPLRNDPIVSYVVGNNAATAAQIEAFHGMIDGDRYLRSRRGSIAERNGARNPWINQFDVSFQQELPGFMQGHKSVLRLDVYNFLNLLNKDWGVVENIGGFDTRNFARLSRVNADGTYVYDIAPNQTTPMGVYDFNSGSPHRPVSRWAATLTLRYQF
ncbi:MAG: carboxypeptidase regulatory-like domain-containing protein [Pseudoxanthomonas suwonensis]|nr:carboxypeptidase regulatory-like domain-containing protein [Pseudoxanthomonas suwonensis]